MSFSSLQSQNDKNFVIIIKKNHSEGELYSAEILQKWLSTYTLTDIKIQKDDIKLNSKSKYFFIGDTRYSQSILKEGIKNQGFKIDTALNKIFIKANDDRGISNGVVDFLVKDIGFRWYAFDTEPIIPAIIKVKANPRVSNPDFQYREIFSYHGIRPSINFYQKLNPTTKSNSIPKEVGGNDYFAGGWRAHTFKKLIPSELYFQNNPEFFAYDSDKKKRISNGQLCLTNTDVQKVSLQNLLKHLDSDPSQKFVSISQNDGRGYFCSCEKCEQINNIEQSKSGTLLRYLNFLSNGIKNKYPNVFIHTLAYQETFKAPLETKAASNILIQIATDKHNWKNPHLPIESNPDFLNDFEAWNSVSNNLSVWDYGAEFAGKTFDIIPNISSIAENIRTYHRMNIENVYLQVMHNTANTSDVELKTWIWSNLLWDSSMDELELLKDYVINNFSNSSKEILEYYKKIYFYKESFDETGFTLKKDVYRELLEKLLEIESVSQHEPTKKKVQKILFHHLFHGLNKKIDPTNNQLYLDELKRFANELNMLDNLKENQFNLENFSNALMSSISSEQSKDYWNVTEDKFKLFQQKKFVSSNPSVVKYPSSLSRYAIEIPHGNNSWKVQLKLDNHSAFQMLEMEYFNLKVNISSNKDSQYPIRVGIYNNVTKKFIAVKKVNVTSKNQEIVFDNILKSSDLILYFQTDEKNGVDFKSYIYNVKLYK